MAYYEKFSETQSSIVELDEGLEKFRAVVSPPNPFFPPPHSSKQVQDINFQVQQVQNIVELLKISNSIAGVQVRFIQRTLPLRNAEPIVCRA